MKSKREPSALQLTTLSGEEFVEACYQVILNRKSDVQGRTHYQRMLGTGSSKAEIIRCIALSPEAKATGRRLSLLWLLRLDGLLVRLPIVSRLYYGARLLWNARAVLQLLSSLEHGGGIASKGRNAHSESSLDELDAMLNAVESGNRRLREIQRQIDAIQNELSELREKRHADDAHQVASSNE
ncbi:DUF4214 domain-containing protein [Burkholderia cepacia]|uniref:DUF4214 domain-containing protein n=1 Tax=Burkholderia cepacia TaxID=292 RepID=UPI0028935B7B|nr:DUF4214 domain-containing protein [Burkholderia cepacia]